MQELGTYQVVGREEDRTLSLNFQENPQMTPQWPTELTPFQKKLVSLRKPGKQEAAPQPLALDCTGFVRRHTSKILYTCEAEDWVKEITATFNFQPNPHKFQRSRAMWALLLQSVACVQQTRHGIWWGFSGLICISPSIATLTLSPPKVVQSISLHLNRRHSSTQVRTARLRIR